MKGEASPLHFQKASTGFDMSDTRRLSIEPELSPTNGE
jgi:hypothetical protein